MLSLWKHKRSKVLHSSKTKIPSMAVFVMRSNSFAKILLFINIFHPRILLYWRVPILLLRRVFTIRVLITPPIHVCWLNLRAWNCLWLGNLSTDNGMMSMTNLPNLDLANSSMLLSNHPRKIMEITVSWEWLSYQDSHLTSLKISKIDWSICWMFKG